MILKEACILSTLQKLTSEELAELLQTDVKKDLHLHTYYSDGVLSPEEVTDRWASEGYKLIAVTDHDGIEGSLVALEYAADKDITVVPGIEFDSVDPLGRDLHILGYGFDPECPELRMRWTTYFSKELREMTQCLQNSIKWATASLSMI